MIDRVAAQSRRYVRRLDAPSGKTNPKKREKTMAAGVQAAIAAAVLGPVKKHWVLLLALGILMIVLGMLGFYQPFAYTVATTIFFGALLLVTGARESWRLSGWRAGRAGAPQSCSRSCI
jgi:hypothetical protein